MSSHESRPYRLDIALLRVSVFLMNLLNSRSISAEFSSFRSSPGSLDCSHHLNPSLSQGLCPELLWDRPRDGGTKSNDRTFSRHLGGGSWNRLDSGNDRDIAAHLERHPSPSEPLPMGSYPHTSSGSGPQMEAAEYFYPQEVKLASSLIQISHCQS